MKKPKYLYHGSGKKLIGDKLVPKKATDMDEDKIDNSLKAVYATNIKEEAIVMGILSCKGAGSSSMLSNNADNVHGIIYKGWLKQDYFYLYILPSQTFEEKPKNSHQWVSLKPVKPNKMKRLLLKDYITLVRKANFKEKEK